jgi:hypothetical protein
MEGTVKTQHGRQFPGQRPCGIPSSNDKAMKTSRRHSFRTYHVCFLVFTRCLDPMLFQIEIYTKTRVVPVVLMWSLWWSSLVATMRGRRYAIVLVLKVR